MTETTKAMSRYRYKTRMDDWWNMFRQSTQSVTKMRGVEILVRDATEKDLSQVLTIYNHYVRTSTATFDYDEWTLEEMKKKLNSIREIGDSFLVAVQKDQIMGYGYLSIYRTKIGYRFTREVTIYLDPNQKSQGIAKVIWNSLYKRAHEKGYRQIVIMATSENDHSVHFFKKLGAKSYGITSGVGIKFNRWLGVNVMQIPVGDGEQSIPSKL